MKDSTENQQEPGTISPNLSDNNALAGSDTLRTVPLDSDPTQAQPQVPQQQSPTQIQPIVGLSASQMGFNQPSKKSFEFNYRKLAIKSAFALVAVSVIFAILVATNILALSEFKNVSYTNSQGVEYRLDFYTKHSKKELNSGNKQLVSKVSKEGKFPLNFSVSTDVPSTAYNRVKDCSSYTKITDVENSNLNQTIAVCDFGKEANAQLSGAVYVGGFVVDDKTHIITISQDYGDIDLSNQAAAQESLSKFGLDPYKADIEKIVGSIEVK